MNIIINNRLNALWYKTRNKIHANILSPLFDQLGLTVRAETINQVKIQVRNQVINQINETVAIMIDFGLIKENEENEEKILTSPKS